MTKLFRSIVVLGLFLQPIAGQESQSKQSEAGQAQIFITASSKDDSPANLTTSDIVVSIDRRPVQVTEVRSAKEDPLLFALLVDVSKSDGQDAKAIRELAVQLFRGLAVGENRGYLVLFNDNVAMSQRPLSAERAETNLNGVKFDRSTALYDAVEQTSTHKFGDPENAKSTRRAIVLISDGEDNSSHITYTKAEEAAQKQHVAIFPVLIPSTFTGPVSRGPERMSDFSRTTGGLLVKADKPTDTVQLLLSALADQWDVRFIPAQAGNQKMHSLQVKSAVKGVKVSAPSQVFLP